MERGQVVAPRVIRGELPWWAARYGSGSGDGSGSGSGYGYGDGDGYGSGDGYGYGYGDGYGYGSGSGSGYGYGDGYGYGSGSGSGSGYGSGSGDGYGSGSGSGYGYGDGDGYGSGSGDGSGYGDGYGEDVHRCQPRDLLVTSLMLEAVPACEDQLTLFRRTFPDGARWPDDMHRAAEAGLQVDWAVKTFGLPWPTWQEGRGL